MSNDQPLEIVKAENRPGDGAELSLTPFPRSILTMKQEQVDRLLALAKLLSKSQLAIAKNNKQALSEGDIFIIMMKGISIGMNEMQALESIDLIAGKPTIDGQGMLGLCYASGQLEDITIDATDERCIVTMKRLGKSPHTERFGREEATQFQTYDQGKQIKLIEKTNYKSQPRVMFKWRAIAACARVVFPDKIQGLYTPEELGADVIVNDSGTMQIVTGTAEPVTKTKTDKPEETTTTDPIKLLEAELAKQTITLKEAAELLGIENYTDITSWKPFGNIQGAIDAVMAKLPPAQPKSSKKDNRPANKPAEKPADNAEQTYDWKQEDLDSIRWHVTARFPMSEDVALKATGKMFWTQFKDLVAAKTAVRAAAINNEWPIIVDNATYKGQYTELSNGDITVRLYGAREKLGQINDQWEAYVDSWEKGERYDFVQDEMSSLLVKWSKADGYLKAQDNVTDYVPVGEDMPL